MRKYYVMMLTPFFGIEVSNVKPKKIHAWHVRTKAIGKEKINPTALSCLVHLNLHRINWKLWGDKYKLSNFNL